MKILKVAGVGGIDPDQFKNHLISKLIERISDCEIKFTSVFKADLIFIGPYYKLFNIITNKILRRIFSKEYYAPSISLLFNDIFFERKKK